MSKVKPPKSKGIPSKHLHARTTFLYQAAAYLTLQTAPNLLGTSQNAAQSGTHLQTPAHRLLEHSPLALQLGSDLQQVSRKAQLRLSVDLKRTMCKTCNTILVPGRTATQTVENSSTGGKKPWADILVLECCFCGGKRNFPVGATTQPKKRDRKAALKTPPLVTSSNSIPPSDPMLQNGTKLDSNTA
jgi:ribonuclease P protein subunit RPR2